MRAAEVRSRLRNHHIQFSVFSLHLSSTSTCIWLHFLLIQLSFLHMLINQVPEFTTDSFYHQGGTNIYFLKLTLQFLEKEKVNEGRLRREHLSQPNRDSIADTRSYIVMNVIKSFVLGSGQSTLPAVFAC